VKLPASLICHREASSRAFIEHRKGLLFRSRQTPVPMGVGARLSCTELAFFSGFGATGGAPHRQNLFFRNLHDCIMHGHSAAIWSILTSPPGIKSRYSDSRNYPKNALQPEWNEAVSAILDSIPPDGRQVLEINPLHTSEQSEY
jgi:hypothetical protein